MPKIYLTWKDPDYVDARTGEYPEVDHAEHEDKLRELGAKEYLTVEFDTDNNTSRVLRRGEKIPPKTS